MTYVKPGISKLGHAVRAIQGTDKSETEATDISNNQPFAASANAYQADE